MINIIFKSFLLLILSFAISCENQPPLDHKKFVKLYADIIIMEDTASISQAEVKKIIFDQYKISQKKYNMMIDYFNEDADRWQKFFDDVLAHLENKKPKIKNLDVQSLQEQSESLDN